MSECRFCGPNFIGNCSHKAITVVHTPNTAPIGELLPMDVYDQVGELARRCDMYRTEREAARDECERVKAQLSSALDRERVYREALARIRDGKPAEFDELDVGDWMYGIACSALSEKPEGET